MFPHKKWPNPLQQMQCWFKEGEVVFLDIIKQWSGKAEKRNWDFWIPEVEREFMYSPSYFFIINIELSWGSVLSCLPFHSILSLGKLIHIHSFHELPSVNVQLRPLIWPSGNVPKFLPDLSFRVSQRLLKRNLFPKPGLLLAFPISVDCPIIFSSCI